MKKRKELIFYLSGRNFKKSNNGFVPFDESMINRGYSIFDAIMSYNGIFFDIDSHIERTFNDTNFFGAPIDKIFNKKEFKNKIESLRPIILKFFGKNIFIKLEIISSKETNIFFHLVEISPDWLDRKNELVLIAVKYNYLLQNLKYCGRYAEPMILSSIAKTQIDSKIDECLFYSSQIKNKQEISLEATNSSFYVVDSENRLWISRYPDVLKSTTFKIINKIIKQNINDPSLEKKEKISSIMPYGFPLNSKKYKVKEMFSCNAVRSIIKVKRLIFVDIKNKESNVSMARLKNKKDIVSSSKTPITDYIRKEFNKEMEKIFLLN